MEPTERLKQAVAAYKSGDEEAFSVLYEESNRYLYTCIRKIMGGNDNAQDIISDIMQDTYVEISRSIMQQREEERFLSWAGSIAERKCYAWLKKNRRYVLLQEEDDTFENLADSDEVIPEEVMLSREKQKLVREIIDKELSGMQRLCVIAYYYNEQKQSEIAKELGIPENTVKTNLSRAKAKIRDGVTDLEKKQNIRLHSIAPLLLFMFREDVEACVVPEALGGQVSMAVSAAAKKTAGRALTGKAAGMAAKTKIAVGIAAAGVAGAVGGGIYMEKQQAAQDTAPVPAVLGEPGVIPENAPQEAEPGGEETEQGADEAEDIFMLLTDDTWEHYYARALLSPETKYTAFDLHDFDGDGVPELVVKLKDGLLAVEGFHRDIHVSPMEADRTGYGEKASELICIYPDENDDGVEMTTAYIFDDFEMTEMIRPAMISVEGSNDYTITDSQSDMREVSFEEAWQRIQSWQEKYREIDFKPLEQDIIVETIEACSLNGSLLGD